MKNMMKNAASHIEFNYYFYLLYNNLLLLSIYNPLRIPLLLYEKYDAREN